MAYGGKKSLETEGISWVAQFLVYLTHDLDQELVGSIPGSGQTFFLVILCLSPLMHASGSGKRIVSVLLSEKPRNI